MELVSIPGAGPHLWACISIFGAGINPFGAGINTFGAGISTTVELVSTPAGLFHTVGAGIHICRIEEYPHLWYWCLNLCQKNEFSTSD
jgi:hypothetical protein